MPARGGITPALQIEAPIDITEEAIGPVVSALNDMQRDTGQFQSWRARHLVWG